MKWFKIFIVSVSMILITSNYSCEKNGCLYTLYPQNQGFFQVTNTNPIRVNLVIDGSVKQTLDPGEKSNVYNLYFGEHTWKLEYGSRSCPLQTVTVSDCKSLISQSCTL